MNLKKNLHKIFIVFLFIYAILMIFHLREIDWNILTLIIFICGFVLALFAHARRNYLMIGILFLHMGIEWFEWSKTVITSQQIAINLIHATMDFVFLSHELKAHMKKYKNIFMTLIFIIVASIFFFGHFIPVEAKTLTNLEPFVVGGVLGCILSHIYFHIRKEK